MTLSDLQDAAFWEHSLCLDCTATFDASLKDCPVCGGSEVADAKKVLALFQLLEESDES